MGGVGTVLAVEWPGRLPEWWPAEWTEETGSPAVLPACLTTLSGLLLWCLPNRGGTLSG